MLASLCGEELLPKVRRILTELLQQADNEFSGLLPGGASACAWLRVQVVGCWARARGRAA